MSVMKTHRMTTKQRVVDEAAAVCHDHAAARRKKLVESVLINVDSLTRRLAVSTINCPIDFGLRARCIL